MKLSINTNIINKGNPRSGGWQNTEFIAHELNNHIQQGLAFSPGILKPEHSGKKAKVSDVINAEIIALDIDNTLNSKLKTEAEGYWKYDEALLNDYVKNYSILIYTTPSHTEDHNKFRIVFQLPESVEANAYKIIAKAFNWYFGGDPACSNIDRIFFGNSSCKGQVYNKQLTTEVVDDIVMQHKGESQAAKEYQKSDLNGGIPVELIKEMLSYIPAKQEYQEWLRIVSAVGNYLSDEKQAVDLIENWSPDDERTTECRMKQRLKNINIGTLIYKAALYGFDKNKLYNSPSKTQEKTNGQPGQPGQPNQVKKPTNVELIERYINNEFTTRYNKVLSKVELCSLKSKKWELLTDRDVQSLWRTMQNNGVRAGIDTINNILNSDFSPFFHPFREYFRNLPEWNGEDHIQSVINTITIKNGQQKRWIKYFTKWIVGVVACSTENGVNQSCLVLLGGQAQGKSRWIDSLIPPELQQYYIITQMSPQDKDAKIAVAEGFIVNLDELESSTRDEIGHLKSLITISQINVRRPYGRYSEMYPRRASFIGSINRAEFLTDLTGSRRFLVVEPVQIKVNEMKTIDLDQMYAQAFALLKKRYQYWFDQDEVDEINQVNDEYGIHYAEEEVLLKYYKKAEPNEPGSEFMTTTELYEALSKKTTMKMNARILGMVLKKRNFVRRIKKFGGRPRRGYDVQEVVFPDNPEYEQEENEF